MAVELQALKGEYASDLNTVPFAQLTPGSERKVWWRDSFNHEWQAVVFSRVRGSGCPYCAGQRVLAGFNDLASQRPDLKAEWHPTKNALDPAELTVNNGRKVWWQDPFGHEWEATVASRATGTGCPYCAGQRVLAGFNDLASRLPALAATWHPTKNGGLTPTQVTLASNRKAWWQDDLGHEWQAVISTRAQRGYGCPVCSGRIVRPGVSDLATRFPTLARQWHPTKNRQLKASEVSAYAHRKVWWQDEHGHEWECEPGNRVAGQGCPICAGQQILIGTNDLTSQFPEIAKQWHPTLNGELLPTQVGFGSGAKVWWLCDKGHEWEAWVYSRTAGRGCARCSGNGTSHAEQEILTYLQGLGLKVEERKRILPNNQEIDLYIPELKFGIEFNGLYWHSEAHKTPAYHHDKWQAATGLGIQLVQIWEDDWRRSPRIIEQMLAHKLGLSHQPKVYARKTQVQEVPLAAAQQFLQANHIQGFATGSHYLGLHDTEQQLLALLVLKNEANTAGKALNIIRYATAAQVVGGFTKLLKHAERTYQPDSFITFSDHTVSDGGLYADLGFTADKELAPDYMYIVKGERRHKFSYRLKRFRDDPELQWQAGLTERELARLNNLLRIYDAGKTRWVKQVAQPASADRATTPITTPKQS